MRPGIDPKVDYAFKRLFGREQNVPLLRHFLNAVLKLPPRARIAELQLLNPFSEQDAPDDKLSIVDVKARDQSGRQFHIEMQLLFERAFQGRVLYYWAGLHQDQLHAGDPYQVLRPTISVCLEELNVLSQNDLERERYLARIKLQRDELSRLASAREEGLEKGREVGREEGREEGRLIGIIQAYQEVLQQPLTPREQLQNVPVEQLQHLAQQLKGQAVR